MRERELVFLCGSLGAVAARLVEARGPLHAFFHSTERPRWRIVIGWLLETLIIGIVAGAGSCLVWALYTTSRSLDTTGIDPALAAESFIVGLGGVSAVQRYMHEAERGGVAEQNAAGTADAAAVLARLLKENLDKPPAPRHDEAGGPER